MARSEKVTYRCDVCGSQADAMRVPHTEDARGYNYVRPNGWGNLYMIVQKDGQKRSVKRDFCSEDCGGTAFNDFMDEAYS